MSHLKEPVVINFTAVDLANNDEVLIFSAPFLFTFNANFYGSYGWIPVAPGSDVAYYMRNETTNTSIGRMDVLTTGDFVFNSTGSASIFVSIGDTITISSPATNGIGRFGVSLVGER